ncbi:MAG: hypothetical protein J6W52_12060 [Bacteroidaceae bacterium]|nr:hypothetical protein [Bacteroidaceae bacterium]
MKKFFSLLAFLGIAATSSAQVTFSYDSGQNSDNWDQTTSPENVTNNNVVWRANPGESGSYVILKTSDLTATHIQGYTITLASNSQDVGRLPYTWTLEGSDDKGSWTLIHRQMQANRMKEDFDNPAVSTNSKAYTYYCNTGTTAYKYYKLNVTAKYGGDWGCFEILKFDLIPSNVGFSATDDGMDGNTGTKKQGNSWPQTVVVTGTASARMTGFQFTTGNDNASWHGRNPRTIQVEGSTDNEKWDIVEVKTGYTGLEDKNYYPYVFQCYGTQDYQYYKFSFNDVSANWFQMSELAIITESTASCGSTHTYSSEGFCKKCLSPEVAAQDGSSNYLITNAGKFVKFAQTVNSGTTDAKGKLTADIDLTNVSWTPIGNSTNKFQGTFDGQLKNVTLNLTNTEGDYQGLFGVLGGGARVNNVIVQGTVKGRNYVGGIAGGSNGAGTVFLTNCGNESSVTASGANGSGVFGCNYNGGARIELKNCYNAGTVRSDSDGGALAGWLGNNNGMWRCFNVGDAQSGGAKAEFARKGGGDVYALSDDYYGNSDAESGKLCYDLNASAANSYYQTIGTDAYPKLSNTSEQVLYVGAAGYTTFYDATNDWELNGDAKAYIGNLGSNYLHLEEIADIPHGTAVVIGGTYYNMVSTTATANPEGNVLKGSDGSVEFGPGIYVLANKSHGVGFYVTSGDGKYVPAGKAYLDLTGSSVKEAYLFNFDESETGIDAIDNDKLTIDGAIYNLAGQRLNRMQKGINIVNGKKVLF